MKRVACHNSKLSDKTSLSVKKKYIIITKPKDAELITTNLCVYLMSVTLFTFIRYAWPGLRQAWQYVALRDSLDTGQAIWSLGSGLNVR